MMRPGAMNWTMFGVMLAGLMGVPAEATAQTLAPELTTEAPPATMVKDVLAVDLASVLKLAQARNIDIAEAQQRIRANRGDLHASIGSALPTIGLGVNAVDLQGAVPGPGSTYQVGRFSRVSPMGLATWILNPGQAIFDILAARKRLDASKRESEETRLLVERNVALAFYALARAQAHVAATQRRIEESEELARLANAREKAGLGLALDAQRAEATRDGARLAAIQALNDYYAASVKLASMLNLDPAVMLVPARGALQPQNWVRDDESLEALLARAFLQRPDLAAVRQRLGASEAAKAATLFAVIGPQLQANGQLTNTPPATQVTDTMFRQQLYGASVTLTLSAGLIGRLQGANAAKALAGLEVERNLEAVRADVVSAQQSRIASTRSVPLAAAQLQAAQNAYDLARSSLRAGTAVMHDVLLALNDLEAAREAYDLAVARDSEAQVQLLYATGEAPRIT